MKRRNGLTRRMAAMFAAILLFVLMVVSLLNALIFGNRMQNSLVDTMHAVSESNMRAVERLALSQEALYDTLVDRSNVYVDYLLNQSENMVENVSDYVEINDKFKNDVSVLLNSQLDTYTAYFFVSDDMPLHDMSYLQNIQQPAMLTLYNTAIVRSTYFEQQEWYQRAIELDGKCHWFKNGNNLCMARALITSRIEKLQVCRYEMGVLFLSFDADWFDRNVISERLTPNSGALLCDTSGNILWSNASQWPDDVLRIQYDISCDLCFEMLIPWNDIKQMSDQTASTIMIMLLVGGLMGATLVVTVSFYISRPINTLSCFMKERMGELIPDTMMPSRQDEIGTLYESYNRLILTLREREISQKKTEIERMQAQINPHFLYNTLDSMCFAAMARGCDDIADVLSDLARIYRYNVKDADGEVSIEKELSILRMYVSIYRKRSIDPIEFQLQCDEKASGALIPKMIIQPLVENAILYGTDEHGCTVRILCERRGDLLRIMVADSGGKANVEELNDYLLDRITIRNHSTGIGILNVHRRIRMRYGEEYGLHYGRSDSGETIAVIELPFHDT